MGPSPRRVKTAVNYNRRMLDTQGGPGEAATAQQAVSKLFQRIFKDIATSLPRHTAARAGDDLSAVWRAPR